jgi:hypothetical protein|tara:strand:- start:56 stop:562 length:507 start_codon:yes stop_codon:yes gene_type:complete
MWGFIKKIFESEESKTEKIIKSAPDKATENKLRALNIALKRQRGAKISLNDEKWYAQHTKKSEARDVQNAKSKKKRAIAQKAKKKAKFIEKYGKELGTKIAKGELWIGMNKEALMAIKGKPEKKTETISRNKKREEYFYDGKKNRQGNMSYKLKVILIDELLEKWAKS